MTFSTKEKKRAPKTERFIEWRLREGGTRGVHEALDPIQPTQPNPHVLVLERMQPSLVHSGGFPLHVGADICVSPRARGWRHLRPFGVRSQPYIPQQYVYIIMVNFNMHLLIRPIDELAACHPSPVPKQPQLQPAKRQGRYERTTLDPVPHSEPKRIRLVGTARNNPPPSKEPVG
jgi:hypothetical protein